jgi:YidC/Oxa1 family membrane protein insertase
VRAATDQECRLSAEERGAGALYQSTVAYATRQLEPGEHAEYADRLYFGPKEIETLEAAGAHLDKAVDFGWLSPLCRFLLTILKFFHGLVGNWGVAIILLTVSVKLLLLPLTQKSMSSMKDMRRIKPLMDQVNEKFKDDVAKKNQAMMQLYKTHKINPFSGCLPAVAQAPVWIALYQTLWRAVELYRSPFLFWYQDLSSPDAYFVLPLLLGATMFIQQKITPTTMDSMQAKIMLYMMPAMFLVFMLFLPAGLALYSLVNSVLTIVHTQTMYRMNPDLVAAPAPKGNDARGTKPRKPDGRAESTPSGQSRGASKGEGRESRPST